MTKYENSKQDNYDIPPTEAQLKLIKEIEELLGKKYSGKHRKDAGAFIQWNMPELKRIKQK